MSVIRIMDARIAYGMGQNVRPGRNTPPRLSGCAFLIVRDTSIVIEMDNLKEGTEIYYTGDMANIDGFGVISEERPGEWGRRDHIKMEDGRAFWLGPESFSPGPGRRFMTKAEWKAHREARIKEMKERWEFMRASGDFNLPPKPKEEA